MTKWNQALEAYDDECEAIEQVREEFASYLRTAFDAVSAALVARMGVEWKGKYGPDTGPATAWYAAPRKVGLHAWNARAFGGPPRSLQVGISLDVRSGFSVNDGATRSRLFWDAATEGREAPGEAPDGTKDGDVYGDFVRVARVQTGERAATELAERAVAFADLVKVLDDEVETCDWLARALEPLLEQPPPVQEDGVAWEAKKLKRFAAGFYIQLDHEHGGRHVWALARPPGQLLIGHDSGQQVSESLRKVVQAKPFCLDGDADFASMLLDPADVEKLRQQQDVSGVQRLVAEAFAAYLHLTK